MFSATLLLIMDDKKNLSLQFHVRFLHNWYRFLLLDPHLIMMTSSFLIPSLKSFNLMVPIPLFKKGLKHLKLFSTLKIRTTMVTAMSLQLVSC